MAQRDQPIPIVWRKSSFSEAGSCVEVAWMAESVLLRDSKNPAGPVLSFSLNEWHAFLAVLKEGHLDFRSD